MDSEDDSSSSGGGMSRSTSSPDIALSPHPEEENLAPPGKISNANSTLKDGQGSSKGTGGGGSSSTIARTAPSQPFASPVTNSAKRRRLASPTASITYDGAHATPPSAIGGGLAPSSPTKPSDDSRPSSRPKESNLDVVQGPPSSAPSAKTAYGLGKGKKKDTGQGEGWEEVLERLGNTAGRLSEECHSLVLSDPLPC